MRAVNRYRALGLTVASALAVTASVLTLTGGPVAGAASTGGFPGQFAAPYLQISSSDAGDMSADMSASGLKFYTLAFLVPKSGCTPEWEDNGDSLSAFTSKVHSLQDQGGDVIISSGGESGGELAQTCTSVSSLEAEYAKYVSTYGTDVLDFDIEGSTLSDSSANSRRDQALAKLQKANPAVEVDFTLPVNPNGLPSDEISLLNGAVNAGVNVNLVNILTMDFGNGQNVLSDTKSAITDTAKQLESVFQVSGPDYGGMGVTPIAGHNDDNENFTTSDARTIEGIAVKDGIQELAFWEVDGNDKPTGYQYSKIFNGITG